MIFTAVERFALILACCALILAGVPGGVWAQEVIEDPNWADPGGFGFLPYLYPAGVDNDDLRFGLAVSWGHFPQRHTTAAINMFAGTKGSFGIEAGVEAVQVPILPRLFVSARAAFEEVDDLESFRSGGNPLFLDERAGASDSDAENRYRGDGRLQDYRLFLRYLLPIGEGRETLIPTYVLEDGLGHGKTDWRSWNPWKAGRSFVGIEGFYAEEEVDSPFAEPSEQTIGALFELRHEHLDVRFNPARGSAQVFRVTRDPGSGSRDAYTALDAELTKYFLLSSGDGFIRESVLALDFWTAYVPTWNVDIVDGREVVLNRPPSFTGATLGGPNRLRAFPRGRFSDKAAIYYAAELRLVPRFNPFGMIPYVRDHFYIPWWQVVPFIEIGQVAPHWSVSELHRDLKVSGGVGIRFFVGKTTVRLDIAGGEDGVRVQAAIGQPFHRR